MANRRTFKEPRTKWKNSKAKIQLYDDLVNGVIPLVIDTEESEETIMLYYNLRDVYMPF